MPHPTIARLTNLSLAVALAAPLAGCLERKEKIVIQPDGSVKITLSHHTDSRADLYEGDAAPSLEGGWWVQEKTQVDQKGKTTWTLAGELALPPGAALPSNYAALREVDADVYLQFPTTLTIEKRADGVYYHFRRSYSPRPWAQVEGPRRKIQEELQKLGKKPAPDVTHEDRVAIVRAFTQIEVLKRIHFAREAFRDVTPQAPPDGWLKLHAALSSLVNDVDIDRLAKLIANKEQSNDVEELIEAETRRFEQAVINRIKTTLPLAQGYAGTQAAEFQRRYQWHKRSYEITEDLGDDSFEITVQMPGEPVGSNADTASGSGLTWRFSGEFLRDREFELLATSRVPLR